MIKVPHRRRGRTKDCLISSARPRSAPQSCRHCEGDHETGRRVQLPKKCLDLRREKNLGDAHALGALAHQHDRIATLLKPFTADCMIEQHAEYIADLRFGRIGQWRPICAL